MTYIIAEPCIDIAQAIELGYMLDLAWVMVQAGLAREESGGSHSRPAEFPSGTTRTSSGTRSRAGRRTGRSCPTKRSA